MTEPSPERAAAGMAADAGLTADDEPGFRRFEVARAFVGAAGGGGRTRNDFRSLPTFSSNGVAPTDWPLTTTASPGCADSMRIEAGIDGTGRVTRNPITALWARMAAAIAMTRPPRPRSVRAATAGATVPGRTAADAAPVGAATAAAPEARGGVDTNRRGSSLGAADGVGAWAEGRRGSLARGSPSRGTPALGAFARAA